MVPSKLVVLNVSICVFIFAAAATPPTSAHSRATLCVMLTAPASDVNVSEVLVEVGVSVRMAPPRLGTAIWLLPVALLTLLS